MIVMHPKKESLLKTVSMANWRRWGARGGSWERAGSESRGRPRPIGSPTARTASADGFDSVGQPGGRPCTTAQTASVDRVNGLGRPGGRPGPTATSGAAKTVHAYVRPCGRPIGRCGQGIRIQRPRRTAGPMRPCALR